MHRSQTQQQIQNKISERSIKGLNCYMNDEKVSCGYMEFTVQALLGGKMTHIKHTLYKNGLTISAADQ